MSRRWLLCGVLLVACGSTKGNGKLETEVRTVSPFSTVDIYTLVQLTVDVDEGTTGDVDLSVEAESNLLQNIHTSVSGDALWVELTGSFTWTLPMTISATVSSLRDATADNAATVQATGINETEFEIGAINEGSVTVQGSADELDVYADAAGLVDATELTAVTATVYVDTGADVKICVSTSVTGTVDNGASLTVTCGGDTSGVEVSNGGTVN